MVTENLKNRDRVRGPEVQLASNEPEPNLEELRMAREAVRVLFGKGPFRGWAKGEKARQSSEGRPRSIARSARMARRWKFRREDWGRS